MSERISKPTLAKTMLRLDSPRLDEASILMRRLVILRQLSGVGGAALVFAILSVGSLAHRAAAQTRPTRRPDAATRVTNLLPQTLQNSTSEPATQAGRWTIQDIVEVSRITAIAVEGHTKNIAFIVKQPSIALGKDRYGLYLLHGDERSPSRKQLEADYLADLAWRPSTATFTFRADLDQGVQLYMLDGSRNLKSLIINADTARVGGADGLISSCCEKARMTGVLSYQWSPDGSTLWYTKLRLLSRADRRALEASGVVFQDFKMSTTNLNSEPAAMAVELHLFNPKTKIDRLVASVPGDRVMAEFAFTGAKWIDQHQIEYGTVTVASDGQRTFSRRILDLQTGASKQQSDDTLANFLTTPTAEGGLVVRGEAAARHLVALSTDGSVKKDFGPVSYSRINDVWHNDTRERYIFGVRYANHDGLAVFPPGSAGDPFSGIGDELNNCAFNTDLTLGVCSRESLTQAPELVGIAQTTGAVTVLARPNVRYDRIKPLKTVYTHWTNRYGSENDGYITYPRDYHSGTKYPVLLVTHGHDGRNRFAWDGFQWQYPIQVMAERGYFVVSVNEPEFDPKALNAYGSGSTDVPVAKMQFAMGYNSIASMEAAAQSMIDQGFGEPSQIGIAGYSRGASVTTFTLSHSKLFRAGASGDSSWFASGGYWGSAEGRAIYKGLFGGSPLDPPAIQNYLAFAPSGRAGQFSGPLLQQFKAESAATAVELDTQLKEAHIPAELVFYYDETHLLHDPRRRASAMQLSFDWFDYWLMGRRTSDSLKSDQYARWDAMAARWRNSRIVSK